MRRPGNFPGRGTAAVPGTFTDPNIPAGYAPFNIQNIGGHLFVTFALQDAAKHDDVAGPGNGYVDEFDLNGDFIQRIASKGTLDSPWGLAIAPKSFGSLAGDLLVGNFGDGQISAFDPNNDYAFVSLLDNQDGTPLTIDGLWDITTGNGVNAGSPNDLYFSAGPNEENDGVFGVLAAPEPASMTLFGIGLAGTLLARRRGRRSAR